jgi:UDP-N-acetylmuramate--alanine ligase
MHNVYNAMASIAVGIELNMSFDLIKEALEQAESVQRRMEIKGEIKGATVIDDYGHHPTEIKATLKALEDAWPDRRKVVVFQPHRYTRTRDLFNDFTRAFYQSDLLLVMPIYSAGEDKIDGVDGHDLCEDIMAHGHKQVICVKDMNEAVACIRDNLMDRDIVLTLGAGDVWMVGEKLLETP